MSQIMDTKKTSEVTSTCGSMFTPSSADTTDLDTSETYSPFSTTGGVGTIPEPGGVYMIRDLDSDRVITLDGGRLTLQQNLSTGGGWQWRCVENHEGWLGFHEKVSGKYLGRDGKGGFCANASAFKAWEKLHLRPVKKGGYHILAIHWWTLLRVGIRVDSNVLIEVTSAAKAARWLFVEL